MKVTPMVDISLSLADVATLVSVLDAELIRAYSDPDWHKEFPDDDDGIIVDYLANVGALRQRLKEEIRHGD